jgi:hypothetical protein
LMSSTISGNSASATVSDSMQIQPLDDPGSWQAMLTPVDAATIGFFIKQGYSPELLFLLFIDHLRQKTGPNSYRVYSNDPTNPEDLLHFVGGLETLVMTGLTIEIERGSQKSGQTPASHICFQPAEAKRVRRFFGALRVVGAPPGQRPAIRTPSQDTCGEWLPGQQAADSQNSQGKGTTTSPAAKASPSSKTKPQVWYTLPTIYGETWEFTTRSPYAVYQMMGLYLDYYRNNQSEEDAGKREILLNAIKLVATDESDKYFAHIETNQNAGCFVSLAYNGQSYCVPEGANVTKTTFSILHQVTGLNIAHAQTPGTLTVRSVP